MKFNMNDIIFKKREGGKLSKEEIDWLITGYVDGDIPDYQVSALLMAIFFRGLDREETFSLTNAMRFSGDTIDLSPINGIKVDKHSTGGVGDKTTLIVAPLASACGVPIAKMSGRGLGFTGGTVDKMESIPGFRTALAPEEFLNQVNEVGMAVIGQTAHITPADKKLYALRDVTSTVDNFGLIASSIMSKKLAAGSDAIVLDVKCGDGAFMENPDDAVTLANLMVDIGTDAGRKTVAAITDMSQPLGKAVGNSLEVIEAIDTLKGKGPEDITELAEKLSGIMVYLGGKAASPEEGYAMAKAALAEGSGLNQLRRFIEAQGGNPLVIEDYSLFPQASVKDELKAEKDGFVAEIAARTIGLASQHTGAGRTTKESDIDLSAGVYLHKKVGDKVAAGETLAVFYGNDRAKVDAAMDEAKKAFRITDEPCRRPVLIKEIIGLDVALESVLSDGFGGCIGGGGSKVAETMFEYNGKKQGEYTVDDYCQLPDDMRFELIDGRLYYMTAPFTPHQVVSGAVWSVLNDFIRKNKGKCIPFTAPVDVHLLKDGKTMVQPDIIVLCDISKLTEQRIEGAPDFVAEIISPSTRRKDMTLKLSKYTEAGVREYWIIDHKEKKVIVYDIENDAFPQIYGFRDKIPVAIFDGRCQVDFAEIDDTLEFYFGDKE